MLADHVADHRNAGFAHDDLLEELLTRDHGLSESEHVGSEAGILIENEEEVTDDEGVWARAITTHG